MSFVVYFRKAERVTKFGIIKTLVAGGLLVGIILYCLIPGVVRVGGWFELLFTNVMGCPYNTGLIFYIVLLTGTLVFAYYRARRRILKLSLACLLMILAGYSSYGVIFIRANANTPMCENAPGNIFSLGSYLNREQYGDTPLLYGPAYCSEIDYEAGDEEGRVIYRPTADSSKYRYDVVRHDTQVVYKNSMNFPRMYSARHAKAYEEWMNGVEKQNGVPTMGENLRFFLTYQVNFMYWRYFLWNFVGRQNNIQGHGEVEHGNWITGFGWIDDWLLGCDTSELPSDLAQNKGRNVFYALPLILGLAGIVWQWRRRSEGRHQLLIVALLFVMTGLAIVVYLNQTPLQARERDYAYAGSFYAFAIWIGVGVGGVIAFLQKLLKNKALTAVVAGAIICLLVPLQMVGQTWDDHDRSDRYMCRDFGANYLESMQRKGNPIIFTSGDNETFPLWYNQEVEGFRTDTRVCNLEYLQTDWYIDQMKRPAYDSPALPISWHHEDYQEGKREYACVRPEWKNEVKEYMRLHPGEAVEAFGKEPFELKNIIGKWILNDEAEMQCVPTDSVTITSGSGTMALSLKDKKVLYKSDLMVLEMLSKADWSRPVYISVGLGSDYVPFLRDHLVLEGLAYRVSPTSADQQVDVEKLYENIMHRFRFGGLKTKGIYVDEDVRRMADMHQFVMGVLIDSLMNQGDTRRAVAVCRKWQHEMPPENVPYTESSLSMARCFYMANQPELGDKIVRSLLRRSDEWLTWIETIATSRRRGSFHTWYSWAQTMGWALAVAKQFDRTEIYHQYSKQYESHIKQFQKG
jgi:hypothetical protein